MKLLLTILAATLFINCERKTVKNPPPAPTEITSDTTVLIEPADAQNSLAYIGSYKGMLQCDDCPKGQTMIELSEKFNYIVTVSEAGKAREQKGTFTWNKAGDAVILTGLQGMPNQFRVGDKQLVLESDPKSVLQKMRDAEAANTDAGSQDTFKIPGTAWQLAELNGRKVPNMNPDKRFLNFAADNTFGASAGCNSIGGQYEISKSMISFSKVRSTRMACANMEPEQQLLDALERADNFVVNKKVLQLRAGGVILATFDAK